MTRAPVALIALATLAGGALFNVAFEVSAQQERLALLNDEIRTEREAIHVLRAEWTHLNQPERLADLSNRYLNMEPVTVASVADLDTVPRRLPKSLLAVTDISGQELFPTPRLKPPSPPKFATRKVRATGAEAVLYRPAPGENGAFNDLLVRILQPTTGGT
jgi:hypothetical protein